ncbi:MAG TPA: hypothetical protein VMW72_03565 [Sedimentisphaerales bacterium]|nr:hypothetical protein [Sedimentisphaerales bacterium]
MFDAHDCIPIVIDNTFPVGRQRHRQNLTLDPPEYLACLGLDGHQLIDRFVPAPSFTGAIALCPAVCVLLLIADRLAVGIDDQEQHTLGGNELLDGLGARVRANRLARRGIDGAQRGVDAERRINFIADRDEPPRQPRWAALERKEMVVPIRQLTLPQYRPVKGVSRGEEPSGRKLYGVLRAFIHNIEYPSVRRDERIETRGVFVASRPARAADPLHPPRRTYNRIVGYCIATGIVQVMRPFIYFLWPRLNVLCPFAVSFNVRNTIRHQYPHDFRHISVARIFNNKQVHRIVNVWQAVAGPLIDRHRAVNVKLLDIPACPFYIVSVSVQTLHEIAVAGPQCGCKPAVTATDVNNQPALDACGVQNFLCCSPFLHLLSTRCQQNR